jgi:hypothetical protein
MKKLIYSLLILFSAFACADDEFNSAFREYAGIKPTDLPTSIPEDSGTISIPVFYGGNLTNDQPFAVSYTVTGGVYGTDYTIDGGSSANGTVTIIAGAAGTVAKGIIKIIPKADFITESNVTLTVTLTSAERDVKVGYPLQPSYSFTIADDDCDFEWIGDLGGVDVNLDLDDTKFTADVTAALNAGVYTIDGLNVGFMEDFWGETIQTSVPVVMTVTEGGKITIAEQFIFTTDYKGDLFDYKITGTGQVNNCSGDVTINYELDQDGFKVGKWLHDDDFMTDQIFKAVLVPKN